MRVVIIEDEEQLRETNRMLLEANFPNMEVVGEAGTVNHSIDIIRSTRPDLVLTDIELADGNCFQVLQKCQPNAFKTIFITAHNHYAIKAIKFSALDYILKPVNEFEFCNAVRNAVELIDKEAGDQQMQYLLNQIDERKSPKKVVLRTSDSLYLTEIADILYCRSENSYTTFYLNDNKKILVSKGMKEFCDLFEGHGFFRPHQSYLVNLHKVSKIDKSDGGFIIMKNGKEIPISTRRKQSLMLAIEEI